jgi:hypothetical protein
MPQKEKIGERMINSLKELDKFMNKGHDVRKKSLKKGRWIKTIVCFG